MSYRYVQPLRALVQIGFLFLSIWIIYRFAEFLTAATVATEPVANRPGGIEAFLPVSGLLGTAAWFKGGSINPVHPAAVVIFVTIVLLSFLLRRAFCSWICPVGAVSEWLWKLGFKRFRHNYKLPRLPDIALRAVKYLLMGYFLYKAIVWSLDRLQGFLFSHQHAVSDQKLLIWFRQPSSIVLIVIFSLLLLSIVFRNPFCRYLCPYGALLGLVAFISPTAVQRDKNRCVSCGVCNQVCPSGLNIMVSKRVSNPECIGCWRCISHCRVHNALQFRFLWRQVISGFLFVLLVVGIFWGGTFLGKLNGHWHTTVTVDEYRK